MEIDSKDGLKLQEALVFHSPVAFLAIDEALNILQINRAAQKLLSLPPDDIIEENFSSFIHKDSQKTFSDNAESLSMDETWEQELMINTGNGSSTSVHLTLHKYREFMVVWLNNLSELKALSVQIKEQKLPLRKFMHDMGNSLTGAAGYSDLISMLLSNVSLVSGDKLASLKKYHGEIVKSLHKSQELIKETSWQELKAEESKNKNIMVVDDEPSIASLLTELMRQDNHNVQTFSDSREALAYFLEHAPSIDLVISDHFMPGLSGIEMATEMLACRKELQILLCTGDGRIIEQQAGGELNIKHFIRKPIDIAELLNMVRGIFRNS